MRTSLFVRVKQVAESEIVAGFNHDAVASVDFPLSSDAGRDTIVYLVLMGMVICSVWRDETGNPSTVVMLL